MNKKKYYLLILTGDCSYKTE